MECGARGTAQQGKIFNLFNETILNRKQTIAAVCSAMLLCLFLYTAVSKLADYNRFERVLHMAPQLHRFSVAAAVTVPVAELLVCVLLFFPATRKAGAAVSFLLLAVMTGYLVYMLLYAPELPCRCGGVISMLGWKQHVWFNLFFMGLSATAFLLLKHERLISRRCRKPVNE